jgi:hypothetical protein
MRLGKRMILAKKLTFNLELKDAFYTNASPNEFLNFSSFV